MPPADDGFPTNGAQWLFATSLALGPGTPQPSGGGLPVPGTVGEVVQVFTADGSGMLSFDWTWICGETIPQTLWIDFASVDVLDMGGNNVANLLYVDASTTSAFNNIPGATNGPAGPPVFGLSGSTWNTFGNEVLPLGPKTAAYTGLPLSCGRSVSAGHRRRERRRRRSGELPLRGQLPAQHAAGPIDEPDQPPHRQPGVHRYPVLTRRPAP